MEDYQFPSHYSHQSRLTDHDPFVHGSPPLNSYSKVGVSNHSIPRWTKLKLHAQMSDHGGSHQLYSSPITMDPMPILLYPGASPAPSHYSDPSQYTFDNLRISPTLDNSYLTVSPHYEVLPSNSSRPMNFGVRTMSIYPFYPFLT
jgi:hypothetical protein